MEPDMLSELLNAEEPVEKDSEKNNSFNPKFNVREEFVVWVREQFPELQRYSKKRRVYQALESRKDEVYQAALGAVNHGALSTEACASAKLSYGWSKIEKGFKLGALPRERARSLEAFVSSLEDLSISLGGNDHFTDCGRFLNGSSYNSGWFARLNAFVYRVGEENGDGTRYLVFDSKQDTPEDDSVVLIGELTQLANSDLKALKKVASKFKGPEPDFIAEVDKKIPEWGSYGFQKSYTPKSASSKSKFGSVIDTIFGAYE